MLSTPLPSLPDIAAYDGAHWLSGAATFAARAAHWTQSMSEVAQGALQLQARGLAADAMVEATHGDYIRTLPHADMLTDAAQVCTRAHEAMQASRAEVLEAVAEIEEQQFKVGPQWSVSDTSGATGVVKAQREAVGKSHAMYLRAKAGQFMGNEMEHTTNLTTTTAGLGEGLKPQTHMLDTTFKTGGGERDESPVNTDNTPPMPTSDPFKQNNKLRDLLMPHGTPDPGRVDDYWRKLQDAVTAKPPSPELAHIQDQIDAINAARGQCSSTDWTARTMGFLSSATGLGAAMVTAPVGGLGVLGVIAASGGTATTGGLLMQCITEAMG